MGVNELIGLIDYNIKDLYIQTLCLTDQLFLAYGVNGVSPCMGPVRAAFGSAI